MPQRFDLIRTSDGSHTLALPGTEVTFHSRHGALQESRHIFIEAGLKVAFSLFPDKPLRIFEMGFGTGLNALLTAMAAAEQQRKVWYSIDRFPLPATQRSLLNYGRLTGGVALWQQIGDCPWNEPCQVSADFTLEKVVADLLTASLGGPYHLIYFDAFAPEVNPELWTAEVFASLYGQAAPGALLLTYCSKSMVRKALAQAGWQVEKLPGPPGKREIVRAHKES